VDRGLAYGAVPKGNRYGPAAGQTKGKNKLKNLCGIILLISHADLSPRALPRPPRRQAGLAGAFDMELPVRATGMLSSSVPGPSGR
jgi:hypothetical protein